MQNSISTRNVMNCSDVFFFKVVNFNAAYVNQYKIPVAFDVENLT
jgi:hypothetical protein